MDVSPEGSGDVLVNGEETDADPRYPWAPPNCDTTGEIRLEAVAGDGYVFDHWSSVDSIGGPDGLDGRTQNPATTEIFKSMFVTAHFIANMPDADAGADIEIFEGDPATLDGTASTEPLGRTLLYEWTQVSPPAPRIQFSGADTATPSFTAPDIAAEGSVCFAIRLTVTDPEGRTDTDEVGVWVASVNEPPVAILVPEALTVGPGEPVFLDGSASFDPDGTVAAYAWDIVSGNPDIGDALHDAVASEAGENLAFTAPDIDGTVVIALRVTDAEGRPSEAAAMTLTIEGIVDEENQAPTADAGADQTVAEGEPVVLDGSGSSDPDGVIGVYRWELSEGIGVAIVDANTPRGRFTAPQVDGPMTLTFRLTVTDDKGASAFDTVTVTILDTVDGNGNGMPDRLEAREGDADGDGVADFDDPDSVCFRYVNGEEKTLSFYTDKGSLRDIVNVADTDTAVPQAGKPDGNCPFGVISYRIIGLQPGDSARVVFGLPETVPEGVEFYKIGQSGWQKLSFSPATRQIAVTLTDGDPLTDEDGVADGVIEDPSAIVVSEPSGTSDAVHDIASSGGGCFIGCLRK